MSLTVSQLIQQLRSLPQNMIVHGVSGDTDSKDELSALITSIRELGDMWYAKDAAGMQIANSIWTLLPEPAVKAEAELVEIESVRLAQVDYRDDNSATELNTAASGFKLSNYKNAKAVVILD